MRMSADDQVDAFYLFGEIEITLMPDMGQGDNFIDMFLVLYFFYCILCGLEGIMKDNAFSRA